MRTSETRSWWTCSWKLFSKNYYAFFERLRWATRTSEENSIFLLDAVNTILVNDNIKDGVPVEVYMHPVIATSKANHKRKVEHFKQAKDDRNFRKKDAGKYLGTINST